MFAGHLTRPLNLFYDDGGHTDRWFRFDRFPRAIVRRIVRGPRTILGLERVFLNLLAGLDRLRVPYRVNDYRYMRAHPEEVACVIGKSHILPLFRRETPIIFGSAVHNHPIDAPNLFEDNNVIGVLVPCDWARTMFSEHWGGKVHTWAVGVDTDRWKPSPSSAKDVDILVYEKIRCHPARDRAAVRDPILEMLSGTGLKIERIVYGHYREEAFEAMLRRSKAMVFLCEHETQGIALQQTLACDIPVFAWDLGGVWQDTDYHPHRVIFGPVSSVPYWDDRCGMKFKNAEEFCTNFSNFWVAFNAGCFSPRSFIVDGFTLEARANHYVELVAKIGQGGH